MFGCIYSLFKLCCFGLGIILEAEGQFHLVALDGTYAHNLMGKFSDGAISVIVLIGSLPFAVRHF